ncbi:MAG: LytTR family DNA-binding domain-containing protein [Bacteroidota bacterium]
MKSLKTIIIDDEEDARALLKHHLLKLDRVEIIGEAQDGAEAISVIAEHQPDLVLLDIEMPEFNGIEVLQRLDTLPYIIFVTAFNEYAIQAFEMHAVDYLLKPFTEERLFKAIHKAEKRIVADVLDKSLYLDLLRGITNPGSSKYLQRLSVKINHKTHFIEVSDIVMIEAADQYVSIQTTSDQHLARMSMDSLEKALDPTVFIRTHRSYIVTLSAIQSLEQYEPGNLLIHLKGGFKAKLSQSRKVFVENRLKMG